MNFLKGALILAGGVIGSTAFAFDFAVSTDSFNYNGTVTKYASLSDAQNNVNPLSVGTMQNRDGSIYQGKNAENYLGAGWGNANTLLTAWYYTTDQTHGAYSGWGNPNNTYDSFMQLYDQPGAYTTSSDAVWSNNFSQLNVSISGANADSKAYSRLWPADSSGGDHGVFLNYSINYSVSGLAPTIDPSTGWLLDNTSRGHLTGSFTGIFQDNDSAVTTNNGFYAFNVNLFDSGHTFGEDNAPNLNGAFNSPFFAAPVPEPASMAVLGLGAVALVRRRKKS